jgi:hypothetical protein
MKEIEIPKTWEDGMCKDDCPFYDGEMCRWQDHEAVDNLGNDLGAIPGPNCPGPGTYVLMPKDKWQWIKELLEAYADGATDHGFDVIARNIRESIKELDA